MSPVASATKLSALLLVRLIGMTAWPGGGNGVAHFNEVTRRRVRLVLGWVAVGGKSYDAIRTRRYSNVRSKADMSRLNLPHGTNG